MTVVICTHNVSDKCEKCIIVDMVNKNEKYFNKIQRLLERIEHLEKWALTHETEGLEYGNEFEERDKKLTERISMIEEKLSFQMDVFKVNFAKINSIQSKKPYRCPVCKGKGKKEVFTNIIEPFERREIDSLGRHFVRCNACDEKGIVWG